MLVSLFSFLLFVCALLPFALLPAASFCSPACVMRAGVLFQNARLRLAVTLRGGP